MFLFLIGKKEKKKKKKGQKPDKCLQKTTTENQTLNNTLKGG
jgi:hypothetical protein